MVRSSKSKKVFVAMSGGVDSSVAAFLLQKKGYDATGIFMRCYNIDGCAEQDAEDARRVAEAIGIPLYIWDFEEEYKRRVVQYMIDGYRRGLTPNPDVMCNKEIKFGLFFEKARSMGADFVATGHYVRLRKSQVPTSKSQINLKSKKSKQKNLEFGAWHLEIAKDELKDQSYFLWTLTQEQLKHCLFPIGDYLKSEVREIARKAGLPTAEKKDSQGICFLGKVTLQDFLKEYIPEKRGVVLSVAGDRIGEHSGAQFYTIGQRHIGVANRGLARTEHGLARKEFRPLYVAEKNVKANTLTVAEGSNHPALYKGEVELTGVNFIDPAVISLIRANKSIRVMARVRYRQPLASASIRHQASGIRLIFDKPQKFVAAGQSAVFYGADGELLGGGIIL